MDWFWQLFMAIVAAGLGVFGTLVTASYRENISTKKERLKYFYAPLEILVRMNAKGFERYIHPKATQHDKEYIEEHIWYPNHVKTKELIMNESHHLSEMPNEILELLQHINVWLSEYELKHEKGEAEGAVFAGPKGYPYPQKSDQFIYDVAEKLRNQVNKG